MWAHQGFFEKAEPFLREAYSLRLGIVPQSLLSVSWNEVNLGNIIGSMGRYEESLEFQLSALRHRQISAGEISMAMREHAVLYQNIGRSMFWVGRYQEAHIWCHMAISLLPESQNWGMLA